MVHYRNRITAAIVVWSIALFKTIFQTPRGCCRFSPTCSVYAKEAFETFGVIKATFLVMQRLSRCHPFSSGGYNPVPSDSLPTAKGQCE